MGAQHLPRDVVRPSSGLKNSFKRGRRIIFTVMFENLTNCSNYDVSLKIKWNASKYRNRRIPHFSESIFITIVSTVSLSCVSKKCTYHNVADVLLWRNRRTTLTFYAVIVHWHIHDNWTVGQWKRLPEVPSVCSKSIHSLRPRRFQKSKNWGRMWNGLWITTKNSSQHCSATSLYSVCFIHLCRLQNWPAIKAFF